jgi:hypothetical protein
MSACLYLLNWSTQHFILNGKDGVVLLERKSIDQAISAALSARIRSIVNDARKDASKPVLR